MSFVMPTNFNSPTADRKITSPRYSVPNFVSKSHLKLMEKMDSNEEDSFNKITSVITESEKYEKVIHEVCHMPHVTNLNEFYKMYDLEERTIDKSYNDQPKVPPSIELFGEVFKKFDEYPTNLQKPKKLSTMRERLNSNISKSSPTLNDSIGLSSNNEENSLSLLNLNKFDDVPTASETLSNFVKFQKQLKLLNSEIKQQEMEKEYGNKLKQLGIFAQQLEKLLPTEKVGQPALSSEEEAILEDLVNRMEDLNYIRGHHKVFRQQNILNVSPKLESLVNILSQCLSAINSFNTN